MIPILVCIPYWSGDAGQALELCKIIAGLQNHHAGQTAHIMLVCRQDSAICPQMVKLISSRFNTLTHKCQSPLRGWPSGPNGMFGSTMIHIAQKIGKNYECIYWMEPDAVPIRPNWFWDLVTEWRRRPKGVNIVGCRSDCNGNGTGDHITGCALYDPRICKLLPEIVRCDRTAWDYQCRARIVQMGMHTKLIQNWYKARNAHAGILDQSGVVIIHGHKDNSMISLVKKKYKIAA